MLTDPNTILSANDWRDQELATPAAMAHPDEPCPITAENFDAGCTNVAILNMREMTRMMECMTLVETLTNESYLMSRLVTECGSQHGTVLNLINDANSELAVVLPGDDANLVTLMLLTEKDESTIRAEWSADIAGSPPAFTPSMTTSIACPFMVDSCANSNTSIMTLKGLIDDINNGLSFNEWLED